jgi:hypothetical protein
VILQGRLVRAHASAGAAGEHETEERWSRHRLLNRRRFCRRASRPAAFRR